jgi:ferredoxin
MTYVIAEPCIGTLSASCVEVCPVDCIQPTSNLPARLEVEQLYIDPSECIDCNACVDVCPVEAIFPADDLPAEWRRYAEINAQFFTVASGQ